MKRYIVLLFASSLVATAALAQCDSTTVFCDGHMADEYISDGQTYRALIYNDQVAEFQVTLFGNTTYRMAACSGASDGNLLFTVYDRDRNPLFSNAEFASAPFWDFNVTNTMDVIVEGRLDVQRTDSGCAVLLIGFKQ